MKKLLAVLICALCLAVAAGMCVFPAAASEDVPEENLPTVDPPTVRVITYFGDCKVGHWLNVFDESYNCTGYVSVVFSAAAPFHQFGFPVIWSGTDERLSSAEGRFAVYEFKDDEETTMKGTPVFAEDVWFRHDNGYGLIVPMEKFLPAGKYMLVVSQLTPRTADTNPYIVMPKTNSLYTNNYLQFGGISDSPFAFYVDFLKTDGIEEYFLPIGAAEQKVFHTDDAITITGEHDGAAHSINDEDYAMLSPVIPDGKVLHDLTLISAPTWSNNGPGSNMSFMVYRWNSNYENTLKTDPVYGGTVKNHLDCADLTLDFEDRLPGGAQYLIVMRGTGPMSIGFWNAKFIKSNGWTSYINGERVSPVTIALSRYTTATVEIIPATTDAPAETATSEAWPDATPSGGSQAGNQTGNPSAETPTPASSGTGKGCGTTLLPAAACHLLIVAGTLFAAAKRKRK